MLRISTWSKLKKKDEAHEQKHYHYSPEADRQINQLLPSTWWSFSWPASSAPQYNHLYYCIYNSSPIYIAHLWKHPLHSCTLHLFQGYCILYQNPLVSWWHQNSPVFIPQNINSNYLIKSNIINISDQYPKFCCIMGTTLIKSTSGNLTMATSI